MLKLIEVDSSYFHDEPNIRLVNAGDTEGLIKAAADSAVTEFVSRLQPEQDRVYVHILAMGASEAWGGNRNADSFPEQNLIEYHKTFETSPAHIFRNHVNKNANIAIGQVIFSTYNNRMRRVEVIAWIDKKKGADVVERIEQGDFPPTSMACRTPYDVCSICGNKAHTRQEYCEHLSGELGRIYPDGRKVTALNVAPLTFFDMSIVVRPADVTSAVLQKVASADAVTVGSAEMAEIMGLTEKAASHNKLADLIKEIEGGSVVDYSDSLKAMLGKVQDPSLESIPALSKFELGEVLHAMVHLGISPSLRFLADMIGHRLIGEEGVGVGSLVEAYIGANGLDNVPLPEGSYNKDNAGVNPAVVQVLAPNVKQASLLPEYVTARAVSHSGNLYIPGTNVGYIGNGPMIEESATQRWNRLSGYPEASHPSGLLHMIKTLMVVGGAALAAKWYITHEIERKAKEMQHATQGNVKIVLVKSAEDLRITSRLAKFAMVQAIQKV